MSLELRRRIFDQLDSLVIVDPHTHINALDPASHSLADILGYHYYTELAHSAGLPQAAIEDPSLSPKDKVQLLIENLGPISNTIQWSWFVEMAQKLFGFQGETIDSSNWEALYDDAERQMQFEGWTNKVLETSKLSAVFLTNEFDDPLEGFDTNVYIPCLRTDDLVFHLAKGSVRDRLERFTGIRTTSPEALRQAIGSLFDHFISRGARACAISLPPDFAPQRVSNGRAQSALEALDQQGVDAADSHKKAIANFVFWTLCEYCSDFGLPFDLMIGVNRAVYPAGVHQGRDLYDSRVSLHQYKEVFNAFPGVKFPLSVLASVTNQELTSYAWIFPNVITSGHWWYSNTPTFIEHDLGARLEAVPRTKQIGYYSDMYKLEFALPKFAMYKRCLAKVLAEKFVQDRGWSEEQAVALGTQVLQGNTEAIFPVVPLDKVQMRREQMQSAFSGPTMGGFPEEGDTFESVAGPKLGDVPSSSAGSGLPIGGVAEGSLAALAVAPLMPGSFENRIEPLIDMDQAETEQSPIHSGALSPEVHLPLPHFAPHEHQTEEDRIALDEELALDPQWKHDLSPHETNVPIVKTGDPEHDLNLAAEPVDLSNEPLELSGEPLDLGSQPMELPEESAVAWGESSPPVAPPAFPPAAADEDEIVLESFDDNPLGEEEPMELSLDDAIEESHPPVSASEFTARETVVFDPTKGFGQFEEEAAPEEPVAQDPVADDQVAEIQLDDVSAAEAPTLKAAKVDDFDDMLAGLDLEPENPQETKPPETNDPPQADPQNPWGFLKK
jgi:glucuronate isomerase